MIGASGQEFEACKVKEKTNNIIKINNDNDDDNNHMMIYSFICLFIYLCFKFSFFIFYFVFSQSSVLWVKSFFLAGILDQVIPEIFCKIVFFFGYLVKTEKDQIRFTAY